MSLDDGVNPVETYEQQAAEYIKFAEDAYSWNYVERPGFDTYISDFYCSNTKVLDVGSGSGRVIKHLLNRGIAPKNTTGLEPSNKLLDWAKGILPEVNFIQGNGDQLPFAPNSLDLITANMVFQYMDQETLQRALHDMFDVLKPGGTLFFIGPDPDHDAESLSAVGQWSHHVTPWDTKVPAFNHDLYQLLLDDIYFAGFDRTGGWTLNVDEAGRFDQTQYEHYANRPSRYAARLTSVSANEKKIRLEERNLEIPHFS